MIEGISPQDHDSDPKQWKRELLSLQERIAMGSAKLKSGGVIFCKHMAKVRFDFAQKLFQVSSYTTKIKFLFIVPFLFYYSSFVIRHSAFFSLRF